MSCSPFDLKDYFLKELPPPQALRVEEHVRTCAACREEFDRLGLLEAALLSLREEEIPRRIAFVSDRAAEPAPWRRRLAAFWASPSRVGFASAAMLSIAIVTFAFTRPPSAPAPAPAAQVAQRQPASLSPSEVEARIQNAVAKAVADSEARQGARTEKLVADFMRREREDGLRLARAADTIQYMERRYNTLAFSAAGYRSNAPSGVMQ